MEKYKLEDILDITQPFIQKNADASFIQQKMYENTTFMRPHLYELYSLKKDSDHAIIDAKSLEKFGETILNNNLHAPINAYNLTLPSINEVGGYHAVAFMTDSKTKSIWYQDSYGVEMRKELKDFLKQLLPDYKITYFYQIQQDKSRNDKSCYLLAEYNILDMWYRKNNQKEKIREYTSDEARAAVWNIVKQIKEYPSSNQNYNISKNNKKNQKILSKKFLLTCKKNAYKDFKYNITQEKNYKELITDAVKKAINKHLQYKQGLIDLNLINR